MVTSNVSTPVETPRDPVEPKSLVVKCRSSVDGSRRHLAKPVVVRTFAWTRKAVESRGWRYEVWSEAPPFLLGNVRFLAGYRRTHLFENAIIDRMSSSDLLGTTVGEAGLKNVAAGEKLQEEEMHDGEGGRALSASSRTW